MKNYDYLIAGQGIAGTLLAYQLIKRKKKVFVCDLYNPSSASRVAAGLINPITGKRFVKTWKAEEIIPFAKSTYKELEVFLQEKFFYPYSIHKYFTGPDAYLNFNRQIQDPFYKDLIELTTLKDPNDPDSIQMIEIKESGYIDMELLLHKFREYLKHTERFSDFDISIAQLEIQEKKIIWEGKTFRKVIFCEGYRAVNNPLFSWIPFQLSKGEVITFRANTLVLENIQIMDSFVIPIGNHIFRTGSTYQWKGLDETPTPEGKDILLNRLKKMISQPIRIEKHMAGIRPTVKDRKPILGLHPEYSEIGIFNGLGTKGASLAPFFAEAMVKFLEDSILPDPEVDLNRFLYDYHHRSNTAG